jgi:Family of unknown function (DUF6494)
MDQDKVNMDIRKFLEVVGVTSQREIEHAVEEAVRAGRLKDDAVLKARVVLTVEGLDLRHEIDGEIALS